MAKRFRAAVSLGPTFMKKAKLQKRPEDINAKLAAKKGPISQFIAHNYRHFNAAALLDSATVPPPVFDTVTVHVELPPDPRLLGLHVSPLTTTGAASEMLVVRVLVPNVAVTVAV